MPVGGFPGMMASRRRTIRAAVNPMDKSTVVSIYPKHIHEIKPTIQPGMFDIEAGSIENPSFLVVGPSSWWKEIDEEQPLLEIPNSSIQVADAIVKDYCNGLLACTMPNCMPGMFWTPGNFSVEDLKRNQKLKDLLSQAVTKQRVYFTALVKMADSLWARTNGNPLTISDDMRMGARQLGLTGKDWMKDFTMLAKVACVACGSPRNPDFPICPTCHAIADPEKAKAMGIQFAQK